MASTVTLTISISSPAGSKLVLPFMLTNAYPNSMTSPLIAFNNNTQAPKAFSMNFGAASAVLVASYLKLPVSNTHCMIGAVVAVGRCDGGGDVEWMLVFKIFASWILTVPFSASIAAAIYSILKPLVAGVAIGSDALLMGCIGAACPGLINETNGTNTTPLPW